MDHSYRGRTLIIGIDSTGWSEDQRCPSNGPWTSITEDHRVIRSSNFTSDFPSYSSLHPTGWKKTLNLQEEPEHAVNGDGGIHRLHWDRVDSILCCISSPFRILLIGMEICCSGSNHLSFLSFLSKGTRYVFRSDININLVISRELAGFYVSTRIYIYLYC